MGVGLTLTNSHPAPAPFSLVDAVPRRLRIVRGSVSGGVQSDARIAASGTLAAAVPPDVSLAPGPAPAGYLPLSSLGVAPVAGVGDDTIVNYSTAPFLFGGETYTTIGMTSNGYLVAGGYDDAPYVSQLFPDPEAPNNVLAPFWTDLNPPAVGALRAAEVSVGEDTWLVFDWERVRNYSNLGTNSCASRLELTNTPVAPLAHSR